MKKVGLAEVLAMLMIRHVIIVAACVILAAIVQHAAGAREPKMDAYQRALLQAVHDFSRRGKLQHLKAILDKHPEFVNARQEFDDRPPRKPGSRDKYAALHYAISGEKLEVVQLLLSRGADIEADSGNGWTALHLAVRWENYVIVKFLVENGANLDAKTNETMGFSGIPGIPGVIDPEEPIVIPAKTPLQIARDKEYKEIADYLEVKMREKKGGTKPGERK